MTHFCQSENGVSMQLLRKFYVTQYNDKLIPQQIFIASFKDCSRIKTGENERFDHICILIDKIINKKWA